MRFLHNKLKTYFCLMNHIVAQRIRKLRIDKGISQEQVAKGLCISQPAYARLESGESNTWANHLNKLCELFEIMPEDLVKQDQVVINKEQKGGSSNNAYVINQLSEKLIEQYEKRLAEKDEVIRLLKKE
jgi:transcriptional regulator with XRE-family HTH domain